MAGVAVEELPGGLLGALALGQEARPGRVACRTGAWSRAVAELGPDGGPGPDGAWRRLAVQAQRLVVPGGAVREMVPGLLPGPPDATGSVEIAVLELVVALRDLRSLLPPAQLPSAFTAQVLQMVEQQLSETWDVVRSARPELLGHLLLLHADVLHRAGRGDDAERQRAAAAQQFGAGQPAGSACAALLAGDWATAPFASPTTWDTAPVTTTSWDSALPDAHEDLELSDARIDLTCADRSYAEAERIYRELGDVTGTAVVRWRRAFLAVRAGRQEAAVEEYRRSAAELDAAAAATARLHGALAALAADQLPADPGAARAIADATTVAGPGLAGGLALLPSRLGRHWLADAPERAMAAFGIATEAWRGLGEPRRVAQSLADEGRAAAATGDVATALVRYRQALDADRSPLSEPPDPLDERRTRRTFIAAAVYNLASAARDVPAMARARTLLESEVEPWPARLRELDEGRRMVAEGLLSVASGVLGNMMAELYAGQAALEAGDEARAAERFAAAEALASAQPAAERDRDLAFVAAYRRQDTAASAHYRRYVARLPALPPSAAIGAGLGAQAWRMDRAQAFAFFVRVRDRGPAREQLDLLRAAHDPWWDGLGTEGEYRYLAARQLELEGDLPEAAREYAAGIAAAAGVRRGLRRDAAKTAFAGVQSVEELHRGAARVALRRREGVSAAAGERFAAEAVRHAEDGRSRALLDLLAAAAAPDVAELAVASVQEWRAATAEERIVQDRLIAEESRDAPDGARLAALTTELAGARQAVADVEESMRATAPGFWASISPETTSSGLDDVVGALPPRTVVLQYSIGLPELVAWAITPAGMAAATWSDDQRDLPRLTAHLVSGCAGGVPWERLTDTAEQLSTILLRPFAAAIDAAEHVVVVGSGPTLRLPFGVLPWRGEPLAMRKSLSTLPSLSALRYLSGAPRGGPALVVGNPPAMSTVIDGRVAALAPLPAAGVEAAFVAGVLPDATLLTDDATARRMRELLPEAGLVHLATHGVLDAEAPLASRIMLAHGEALTVAELQAMRLRPELVVLSTCHSGEGALVGGDELLGFGRGLLAAGARSAVLSLWAVDDVSCALLMGRMHSLRRGMSTPDALRAASSWLRGLDEKGTRDALDALRAALVEQGAGLRDIEIVEGQARGFDRGGGPRTPYSHPRHWAAYVVVGS